ncbi:MAG: BRO family protein [Cetobacterium sp.]
MRGIQLIRFKKSQKNVISRWQIGINEPGLYSLITHSKTSFAEAFQELVYEIILPTHDGGK